MTGRVVLLGATGYTGGLVLEAMLRRGLSPVLAGRNRDALAALAERCGCRYVVADVTDPAGIASSIQRGDVLVTTVGPFERFGYAAANAAAQTGAHYVDSTGEVGFVRDLRTRLHDRARETGAIMLPAFGYDYVPGILAGTLAASQAGPSARSLDIGYFATGHLWRGLRQGTRTTMRDGLRLPSPRWYDHTLVDERTASRTRAFPVRERRRNAFLVSGTEVLHLPAQFPSLAAVTVYNGWFPRLSRAATAMSAITAAADRVPGGSRVIDLVTRPVIGAAGGPDATERARTRTHVVAIASSGTSPDVEVHLEGPSIYNLTGELIAWAAHRLASSPVPTAGVVGPVEAFGIEGLRRGCAEVGLAPA